VTTLLEVSDLHAGYGAEVLSGLNLRVGRGQVYVIGPNAPASRRR